jgi:hypothetical protein
VAVVSSLGVAVRRGLVLGIVSDVILGALVLVHVIVIVPAIAAAVVVVFCVELAVEVVDIAEVSRSAARVELPCPERDSDLGVERVRQIFSEVDQQDG